MKKNVGVQSTLSDGRHRREEEMFFHNDKEKSKTKKQKSNKTDGEGWTKFKGEEDGRMPELLPTEMSFHVTMAVWEGVASSLYQPVPWATAQNPNS